MGELRRCECGTLNHVGVNRVRCYKCKTTWAEQGGRLAQVNRGP